MIRFWKASLGFAVALGLLVCLTGCDECEFESISPASLPDGTVGVEYSARITTKGTCNVTYSRVYYGSGELPPGISLDDDGYIEGAPTTEGLYTFSVGVEACFTGSNPSEASDCHEKAKGFSIQINPAPTP